MKKVIIYGTGEYYKNNKSKLPLDIEVVAFADSNYNNSTTVTGKLFKGKEILTPEEFGKKEYDYIYICTSYTIGNKIFQSLKQYDIDIKKIRFLNRIGVLDDVGGWSYEADDDKSLISKIGNIRIREKYPTDFDIVAEVFVNNVYNINFSQKDTVVIDIGMNIGAVSLYFAEKDWVSRVYGFEPFADTYEQALANFDLNNDEIKYKIKSMNVALTDKEEDIEVGVATENTGWRGIMSTSDDKRKVRISCKAAKDEVRKIVDENKNKQIIMKVDTEGSEFAIFKSLKETDLLTYIDAVLIEYHRNPKEILELLSVYKFKCFVVGQGIGMIYGVK